MKRQYTLIGLFAIILLVALSYGKNLPNNGRVLDDDYSDELSIITTQPGTARVDDEPTNATTSTTTSSLTTTTTSVVTADTNTTASTTSVTTEANTTTTATTQTTNATTQTTNATTTTPTTTPTTTTTVATTTTAATTIPTTASTKPTTAAPGRKFDGLSFMGGMILVVGLGGLIYLVVRYLRRTNPLIYRNIP